MKKYSTCTVQYHVQFQGMTIKIMLFHQSTAQAMKKCVITHFTMKIIRTYLYITCNKKNLLKNILAYCGYSPTSPFFLLLSEHKQCDNAVTTVIQTATALEAEWWQVCREAWVRGKRKMSQVLGTFRLLDFTMLRPVLAWRAFLNL